MAWPETREPQSSFPLPSSRLSLETEMCFGMFRHDLTDPPTHQPTTDRRALLHSPPRGSARSSPGHESPQALHCVSTFAFSKLDASLLANLRSCIMFPRSLYSEYLLSSANAEEDGGGGSTEGDARGPGGEGKGDYQRGLGEVFGFPGDARKLRERSKIKLWREYFSSESLLLLCRRALASELTETLPVHSSRKIVNSYVQNSTSPLLASRADKLSSFALVLRYPSFQRLLQVGLPSRLRGELWETLSGSICTCLPFYKPQIVLQLTRFRLSPLDPQTSVTPTRVFTRRSWPTTSASRPQRRRRLRRICTARYQSTKAFNRRRGSEACGGC
jgi:hypothetical protein